MHHVNSSHTGHCLILLRTPYHDTFGYASLSLICDARHITDIQNKV